MEDWSGAGAAGSSGWTVLSPLESWVGATLLETQLNAMVQPHELRNAALGAVVTVLLAFTVVSAVLGGAIAGYLQGVQPRRALKTGAISGVFASIPILLVLGLGFVLSLIQPTAVGVSGFLEILVVGIIVPLLVAWIVGLSALGGFLGAALRRELTAEPADAGTEV